MTAIAIRPEVDLARVEKTEERQNVLAQMQKARAEIMRVDPSRLDILIPWAEAISAASRAMQAADLAREAAELSIRARRRLGELLLTDETLGEELDVLASRPGVKWPERARKVRITFHKRLGSIPPRLFEKVVADLLSRDRACAPFAAIELSLRWSLKKVEPGIWVAWDGTYWVDDGSGPSKFTSYSRDASVVLTAARNSVADRKAQPKTQPRSDFLFAQTRRLAQDIARLKTSCSPDARPLIGEAELLAAQTAELLHEAYKRESMARLSAAEEPRCR